MLRDLGSPEFSAGQFMQQASRLSRLASGSACRSVYGGFVVWGKHRDIPGSSDEFSIPFPFPVHPECVDIRDAILVVSKKEKSVSSRAGHTLMEDHPFALKRYEMANDNLSELVRALEKGDLQRFVQITESEALVLHALMMSSDPSYILIEPNTINIVKAIRQFRQDTGVPVCFTLDAGPNVHLLYPGAKQIKVGEWIENELLQYCEESKWIQDHIGDGPVTINQ
jgi:diphosphomevalonate decarboxylase